MGTHLIGLRKSFLSNAYQHGRVYKVFKKFCFLMLLMKALKEVKKFLILPFVETGCHEHETMANGYSSDRTQQKLSNAYQHGRF